MVQTPFASDERRASDIGGYAREDVTSRERSGCGGSASVEERAARARSDGRACAGIDSTRFWAQQDGGSGPVIQIARGRCPTGKRDVGTLMFLKPAGVCGGRAGAVGVTVNLSLAGDARRRP